MRTTKAHSFSALFCSILILFSFTMPAFAASSTDGEVAVRSVVADSRATSINDTTELLPEEYALCLNSISASADTDLALQSTCELFVSSIFAARRDKAYDCNIFYHKPYSKR